MALSMIVELSNWIAGRISCSFIAAAASGWCSKQSQRGLGLRKKKKRKSIRGEIAPNRPVKKTYGHCTWKIWSHLGLVFHQQHVRMSSDLFMYALRALEQRWLLRILGLWQFLFFIFFLFYPSNKKQ